MLIAGRITASMLACDSGRILMTQSDSNAAFTPEYLNGK